MVPADTRLGACVAGTTKFICIGLNYADHASELEFKPPEEPLVFIKAPNTVTGDGQTSVRPNNVEYMHYEAELVVVIGKTARKVSADAAASFIAGYALANEVSLAEESFYRPAIKAKCRDGFCPIGSLAPVDSVDNLTIITEINGREADSWNTGDLQRNAAELLSALSEFATLNPGDAILIGTPHARVTLQPGDRVRILAEGFPALENPVVAEGELA